MCIELFINPTVIGAIIGAIASAGFAIGISWYKFNKRKNGAKALIKSEINYIINALEKFRDKYVKEEIKDIDTANMAQLINFYSILSNFPNWTNRNWINLIAFIPSIFDEDEINKINQFYAKCDELTNLVNALADKEYYGIADYFREDFEARKVTPHKTITNNRNMLKNNLNALIELGEEIKQIFH